MNYPPSTAPAPAASVRNRRTQRNRRRKKKALLRPWQIAALLILCAGLIWVLVDMTRATTALKELREEKERAYQQYLNEVGRHQVKYRNLIEEYAAAYNVDPAFVAAIIKRESDYDPRAVSRVGAMGLMQFLPSTFDWVAPNCGISKSDLSAIYEPENAIKMGCYLLNYIAKKYNGDPILVACAYHAGWGSVDSWLQKYSSDGKTLTLSQIPTDDTRYYAGKVLDAYAIYQQHYY